jgi:putative membrane protein
MKPCLAILMVLAALAPVSTLTLAQSTLPGSGGVPHGQAIGLSPATASVLRKAASANLFEIESSRLALSRSQSGVIKEFADRMIGDHTRAANRVRQVVDEMGATMPTAILEPGHQKQLDALKAMPDPQFDKAYVEAQYNAHVDAIALTRQYARSGDNERLKVVAAELLPMLTSHLDHITGLR